MSQTHKILEIIDLSVVFTQINNHSIILVVMIDNSCPLQEGKIMFIYDTHSHASLPLSPKYPQKLPQIPKHEPAFLT